MLISEATYAAANKDIHLALIQSTDPFVRGKVSASDDVVREMENSFPLEDALKALTHYRPSDSPPSRPHPVRPRMRSR
jgi:hypothetical protein